MAQNPRVMIRSLKKGTAIAFSLEPVTGLRISIHLKKTNSKNAMLQIKVNFERKFNKRISRFYTIIKAIF